MRLIFKVDKNAQWLSCCPQVEERGERRVVLRTDERRSVP